MKVTVEIPDHVYGRLVNRADNRGVKLSRLIGDAVVMLLGQDLKPATRNRSVITPEVEAQIRAWYRLNWSFADMARELGISYNTVMSAGHRLGLEPLRGAGLAGRREQKSTKQEAAEAAEHRRTA